MKKTIGEKIFDYVNILFMCIIIFLFIFPFWQLLMISFNDATDAMRGGIYFWPRMWTLKNYQMTLKHPLIGNAYLITILRTVIGTICSLLATGMFAYGLSKKHLVFRKVYLTLATITMFFSGGLIPTFLLIRGLGLTNNFWVYIIPSLISVWNMIIMKTFFQSLPASLEESAKIDGYNDLQIFFKIVLPTSTPIIAAIALFNGVGHWNAWFDAYIYINDANLLPLQTILMKIVAQNSAAQELMQHEQAVQGAVTPEAMKITTMMIAIGPIVLIYPFLQKYFMKGIMIGAIKE
ncbi:carbohydrate ABC transporter permease [Vallitalea okinawensis]|uniref:carbohydrate ABC transporter permease n=1 Tax=Vallitalea okinawensis TaxID=2078660 RepID=UPI001FA8BDA0|nr:carbohydrate ABC transporter permease [Vallitalea okinawensis]